MAITRDIPQDICKYESKLIGPFTTRQIGFATPGIILAVGSYFLLGKLSLSQDLRIFIAMVVLVPFLLCGWGNMYGIPFEKFVKMVFVTMVLAPKHRLYKTKNTFDFLVEPEHPSDVKHQKKEEQKKASYKSKSKDLQPFK